MSTNGKEIPPLVDALGLYFELLYWVRMVASCLVGFWRVAHPWPESIGTLLYCSIPVKLM